MASGARGLRVAYAFANQTRGWEFTQCGVQDHEPDMEFPGRVPRFDFFESLPSLLKKPFCKSYGPG